MQNTYHESVMIQEAIEALHVKNQGKYIDATLGTGGHTEEIINRGGIVLGIEIDPEILKLAKKRLEKAYPTPKLILGNFINIDSLARKEGFDKVSGIIFDLGVSNLHLTGNLRGFSFGSPDSILDMRLNPGSYAVTASDLLNVLREDQLRELFGVTMEKSSSKWLAKRVVEERKLNVFKKVGGLLRVCSNLRSKSTLNSATLPFLALRIAVNTELDNLKEALPRAYDLISPGGRLVIISFHSGEDKIAKGFMKSRLILPTEEEVKINPRSRSAKMRVYEKNE